MVGIANQPPVATITSPTNGAVVSAPGVVSVLATASDPENELTRVDFLVNGIVIASETAPPFQIPLQVLTPGAITLQVQAVDAAGAVGASDPVVVTVTGSALTSPPANGQELWLKADAGVTTNADGTVAIWADQSGNGNDALEPSVGGGPTFILDPVSGKPALEFDGSTRYLDIANSPSTDLSGDLSMFYVANFADFAGYRGVLSRCEGPYPVPFDYYATASGGLPTVVRGGTVGASTVYGISPLPAATYVVAGVTVDADTGTHWLNGRFNGSGTFSQSTSDTGKPLRVGSRDDFGTQFKGELAEIIVYNRALSGNDLQQVNSYLAGKFGVSAFQLATEPTLSVSKSEPGLVQVSWPAGFLGFVLEGRASLASGGWVPIATNPPNNSVSISTSNVAQFYRLRSQQ
jgi:Bacterial Ig domain/Concanavalin A-like lectin/glucanases superfamily